MGACIVVGECGGRVWALDVVADVSPQHQLIVISLMTRSQALMLVTGLEIEMASGLMFLDFCEDGLCLYVSCI